MLFTLFVLFVSCVLVACLRCYIVIDVCLCLTWVIGLVVAVFMVYC